VNQAADDSATPLRMACEYGHARVVAALLAAGAAVDQAAVDGAVPLYLACQEGHTVVVSLLLAAGAAVDTMTHHGGTALSVACSHSHMACVKLLSSYGACQSVGYAAYIGHAAERAGNDDVCAHDVVAWLILSYEVTLRLELKTVLAQ
jgi:ankyrin repeat protein